ncbi:MAG: glycosyltransferase [Rhodothermales bacterium]|nr:glycosyltransferase [Rhodothermales bacterium]
MAFVVSVPPDKAAFCVLSFEGPDRYAIAGGLGIRVANLSVALARRGYKTHLLFVGDPDRPATEELENGRLTLHRWSQWISATHHSGVYDGEEGKVWDFNESVPAFVVDHFVRPALDEGMLPVIMAEEWHTAEAVIRIHDLLVEAGLRHRCVMLWNANNTMSFHRVDWPRLSTASQLTTVSRYMKHIMWEMGLNPLVIPNGIPGDLLRRVGQTRVAQLRKTLHARDAVLLFKVGRFDPAKRWLMAVDAAARIKNGGQRVVFVLRGGIEAHGQEVFDRAAAHGLSVVHVTGEPANWKELMDLLADVPPADLYHFSFHMSPDLLRPFYAAADAVLANSGHEPFGLVGLEGMAAGGLVFVGSTGEEYSFAGPCAISLDTDDPEEIVSEILELRDDPDRSREIRASARRTAAQFTWDKVIDIVNDKVRFVARSIGAIDSGPVQPRVENVLVYTLIHQPRRLRLPAASIPLGKGPDGWAEHLFDHEMNERYFRKVATTCYYPAARRFTELAEQGFKMAIGFSLSFVEQAERWDPELLDVFRKLVQSDNVEPVATNPRHGFELLWDVERFMDGMRESADRLEEVFGVRPVVADTTELMMSDTIYHALDLAGFQAAFVDGRKWLMEWREPTYMYHHNGGRLKLLVRHYALSDDVGYRFSDRSWSGFPLMADQYAKWLSESPGDFVVLGWDFETFGEHHHEDSGIFEFLQALPDAVRDAGLQFATPTELYDAFEGESHELPLPAFASTWAGSGGLEFFLGNDAQRAVFHLMLQAYNKALLTGDERFIDIALWLAQSDNLHLIQWFGRSGSEAEVSAYFTPDEWWALGPDRIIWEIQQVYKNFIAALDEYVATSDVTSPVWQKRESRRTKRRLEFEIGAELASETDIQLDRAPAADVAEAVVREAMAGQKQESATGPFGVSSTRGRTRVSFTIDQAGLEGDGPAPDTGLDAGGTYDVRRIAFPSKDSTDAE